MCLWLIQLGVWFIVTRLDNSLNITILAVVSLFISLLALGVDWGNKEGARWKK